MLSQKGPFLRYMHVIAFFLKRSLYYCLKTQLIINLLYLELLLTSETMHKIRGRCIVAILIEIPAKGRTIRYGHKRLLATLCEAGSYTGGMACLFGSATQPFKP